MKPSLLITLSLAAGVTALPATAQITEVIVQSDLHPTTEQDFVGSITVVDESRTRQRAAQNLDDLLNIAPNVNFAAGASRGRFIQVRGIGERSQFVDPVNPSVGLVVDGINLSGVGNAATLFDIAQVELLRGPQGTRFGASALAGMVNLQSAAPTAESSSEFSVGVGNRDSWLLGAIVNGALRDNLNGRLAVQQYKSDGFIDNAFMGRDDTASRDELTLRGKLNWQVLETLQLNTTLLYIDVDNGYDAFTLDNSRTTLSDQPGDDDQQTVALAVNAIWTGNDNFSFESTFAREETDVLYGYDEDWTNTAICDGLACDSSLWGFDWWYSSTDTYDRERSSNQLDLRWVSTEQGRLFDIADWVVGIYAIDQKESLVRDFFDFNVYAPAQFASRYDSTRLAVYGEFSFALTDQLSFTIGGRVEDYAADYADSRAVETDLDETLWGGELSLSYQYDDNTVLYGLVSRGFKAGGVNGEALGKAQQSGFSPSVIAFLEDRLAFTTETARNVELGLKGSYWDDRLQLRLALFDMQRDDVQLKGWYNEGPLFVGYTDNGASGSNSGLEIESQFELTSQLQLFANIGWLDTEIEDFFVLGSDTLGNDVLIDQSGRDQAHAPDYQFNAGFQWSPRQQWQLRVEADGRDGFYFSDSHNQRSSAYTLLHASLVYDADQWQLQLWGRNLTDKDYAVRGFYFPNDPRDFYASAQTYVQLGDPRSYGFTARYRF